METGRIGRRIAYWRDRRGLTQTEFGRLMSQTKRWVQDLEGGKRQTDPRLSVLQRAADVLRIPLEQLLTDQPIPTNALTPPPGDVVGVLGVLDRHDMTTGRFDLVSAPPSLADLRRSLVYCCEAFQVCHYATLGRQLPALLLGAHQAAAAAPSDKVCAAQALLSRVYQLTTSFLHKYGESTTVQAAIAADRALAAAERSGDPVQIGAASRRVAKSLSYQNRPQAAVDFAAAAASRLRSDLEARGPLGLSTLGMLYLNAAIAASAQQRSASAVGAAEGYVEEAADVADQQGRDLDEDYTQFGPTNVDLYRIDVLVRFEDGWSALDAADGLDDAALAGMSRERRSQHHITKARAALLTRRKDDAVRELLNAEELAPEEVRGRQTVVNLVKDLVGATPVPGAQLRGLAQRCGLRA